MLKFLNVATRTMRRMSAVSIRGGVLLFSMLLAGTAFAQFAVSDSGSAVYEYDLSLPPGVGGMIPSLSLAYAAGAGNGPLGYGWSLHGISVITRCPATLATNGTSAAIRYGAVDKLCLDGQRLIQTDSTGAPLSAGSQINDAQGIAANQYREYRTERDMYARIRAYGYANGDSTGASGPAYFKVWYKSGQIAEFGATPVADANTNALITSYASTGNGVVMMWAIARLSNSFGNNIDYKYEQRGVAWGSSSTPGGAPDVGREWVIKEIQYSGNKIIFNYSLDASGNDARTDKSEIEANNFLPPIKSISSRRLKSINYYVNSTNTGSLGKAAGAVPVKNISLSYTYGPFTGRSLIQKIQECVGETTTRCMPGPQFGYTQGSNEAYISNATFAASPLATTPLRSANSDTTFVIPIDVNGDGKTDILSAKRTNGVSSNQLWRSQGNGSFELVALGTGLSSANLTSTDYCSQSYIVDINGDGLPDIFTLGDLGESCPYTSDVFYKNNGDGSFESAGSIYGVTLKRKQQQYIASTGEVTYGSNYYLLDINGDGKLDAITNESPGPLVAGGTIQPCSGACTKIYYGNGVGGFSQVSYSGPSLFSMSDPLDPAVGDVDGDGVDDLSIFTRNPSDGKFFSAPTEWERSRGDGTFERIYNPMVVSMAGLNQPSTLNPVVSCRSGVYIDYNGGGRRGCLSGSSTQGLNSLSGVTNFNINGVNQELGSTDGSIGIELIDVNGDGRQDILRWHTDATKNALYLSNGDGTFTKSGTFNLGDASPVQLRNANFGYVLGDFTGRGAVEILRLANSTATGIFANNLLLTKSDATPPDLMNSVTSGMGVQTSIFYVPLGDASYGGINRYVSDARASKYAVANAQDKTPALYVVARTVTDAGVGALIKRFGAVVPTSTTEYSYAGMKKDIRGRGWLGFREVRRQVVAPNGEALTTVTQRMQVHPYIGMTASVKTYRGTINAIGSFPLSSSTNMYCVWSNGHLASASSHCPINSMVARPYVYQSIVSGNDLDGTVLPQNITTMIQVSDSGEPLQVQTQTTGIVAGVSQTFTKTITNTLDTTSNNTACTGASITDCAWVIGRMSRTSVSSQVPSAGAGVLSQGLQLVAGAKATLSGIILQAPLGYPGVKANAVLTNTGSISLDLISPTPASVVGSTLSFNSTTCTASLAPGANCNILIDFNTGSLGSSTGSVSVLTSAGKLSASVYLTVFQAQGTFTLTSGTLNGPASVATFTNTGSGTITGITGYCQNSNIGQVSVTSTSVAPGAQVSVVGISKLPASGPSGPPNAGNCRAVISGTNATNSPYYSSTY